MYNDLLDVLMPRAQYTCTGAFYKTRPKSTSDGGEVFDYRPVTTYSREWVRLFGNIQAESGEVTIATKERLQIMTGESRVILQNGEMYIVTAVEENLPDSPSQSYRLFGVPMNVERLLRLSKIRNNWSIGQNGDL